MTGSCAQVVRWRDQIEEIGREVSCLYMDRSIMKRTWEVLEANPGLFDGNQNELIDCIDRNYVQRAVVTVWKLLFDTDSRSLSLANLVADVCRDPAAVSREDWVRPDEQAARCRFPEEMVRLLNEEFDRLFAEPDSDHVEPSKLNAMLADAQKRAAKVKSMRHKEFAHKDARNRPRATFGDLDSGIDALGELFMSVHLLLKRSNMVKLEPVIENNWERIFHEPWMADSTGSGKQ